MLVLSRDEGQGIRIGDVEIVILSIEASSVKIGVKAPSSTRVVRSELPKSPAHEPEAIPDFLRVETEVDQPAESTVKAPPEG